METLANVDSCRIRSGFKMMISPRHTPRTLRRRAFLIELGLGGVCGLTLASGCRKSAVPTANAPFDVVETDIHAIQAAMAAGALTSRRVTEAYLARISRLNPTLRAVIETNPDALSSADRLDAERRTGRLRGPVHGLPVLVKDTIET